MQLGARIGAWAKSGAPLPYDAEVEYLESNGTQYIDPVVSLVGPEPRVRFKMRMTVNEDRDQISTTSGLYFRINFNGGGTCYYRYGDNASRTWNTYTHADIFEFNDFDIGSKCLVNGEVLYEANPVPEFISPAAIMLFRGRNFASVCLGYVKIYQGDGSLIRDFFPVRFTNENGVSEGAMYDRVSGQLFRNAGTGAFVIGPDKTV